MLDARFDQGLSLRGNTPQQGTRLIAMVRHGDAATEQQLLWQLCDAFEDFGHPVVVLDATQAESDANPGLLQCVQAGGWHQATVDALCVLPARDGLQVLLDAPDVADGDVRGLLARMFRIYGVVIVYAGPAGVSALLAQSGSAPLLVATPARQVVMSAYRSLKQLFLDAGLLPTVASVSDVAAEPSQQAAQSAGMALQRVAMEHLGCAVDMVTVAPSADDAASSGDVHRLALRLLENAGAAHAARNEPSIRSI